LQFCLRFLRNDKLGVDKFSQKNSEVIAYFGVLLNLKGFENLCRLIHQYKSFLALNDRQAGEAKTNCYQNYPQTCHSVGISFSILQFCLRFLRNDKLDIDMLCVGFLRTRELCSNWRHFDTSFVSTGVAQCDKLGVDKFRQKNSEVIACFGVEIL